MRVFGNVKKAVISIKEINKRGLSAVFIANVVNKLVAFASNVFVVNLLSKKEYGLFSSANNIISFALLITGAGLTSGILQYGSEKRSDNEKNEFYRYGLIAGTVFDALLSLVVCIYTLLGFAPIEGTNKYIFMLVPTIILNYLYNYLCCVLRSQKMMKQYSIILNTNSVFISTFTALGAYLASVEGMIIGQIIAYLISLMLSSIYMRERLKKIFKAHRLNRNQKKEILRYSIFCCLISALNRILYIIDITIISYSLKEPTQIAYYKIGTTIPEALEFIPSSIIVTVLPYFAEHNQDNVWIKKWTKNLYKYSAVLNIAICLLLYLFAPFIVTLLWGKQYEMSIPIFRILSINYFVMSTFRVTGTNILSALRKVDFNLFASIITAIIDIVLDVILVRTYGINGAAWATLISTIIASFLSLSYLIKKIYVVNVNRE